MSEIISVTKEELIQLIGEKNISKLRKAFPDVFNERMHEIEEQVITHDEISEMITIGRKFTLNAKYIDRCFILSDQYDWKICKRYDTEDNYRTWLIPTLKSAPKTRKRRRKTTKTTKSKVA